MATKNTKNGASVFAVCAFYLAGDAGFEPTKRESNSRGLPISLIPNIERLYTSLAKVSSLMRPT